MKDEEKKALKWLYNLRNTIDERYLLFDEELTVKCNRETLIIFSIILNLIEKQSKVIDEMTKEMFYENNRNVEFQNFENIEEIKQYFYGKVEEDV